VNIVVDLHRYPFAVAFAHAKAPHENNVPVEVIFFYGFLHQLYDLLRALQVARTAHANLHDQHFYSLVITSLVKNASAVSGDTENTSDSIATQTLC
jgi:hypothetical protein